MTQNLANFLNGAQNREFATRTGTEAHKRLQRIIIDNKIESGDTDMIQTIKEHPDLQPFFTKSAQTEVPIAGNIHGRFISRRIDRLIINTTTKTIKFIDYKTDTHKGALIDKYKKQIQEYKDLLCSAYPDYDVQGHILWLYDWTLDKII